MHAGTPIYVYATNAITWTRALCVTQVRSVGGASSAEAQVGLDMHIEVSHAQYAAAYAPSPICMHSTDRAICVHLRLCFLLLLLQAAVETQRGLPEVVGVALGT